jgi:hypothetical protein
VRHDAFKALEEQLFAAAPPALARLSSRQLGDLTAAIRAARRRQAEELAVAGDQALGHVPRLLRGPIRKVMGAVG